MPHARPERELIEAQASRLAAIDGAPDWYSTAGRRVLLEPDRSEQPTLHIHLAGIDVEPDQRYGVLIGVQWQAVVPLAGHDDLHAYDVLADMRAALLCGRNDTRITAASVSMRDAGSNYAIVSLTAAQHRAIT